MRIVKSAQFRSKIQPFSVCVLIAALWVYACPANAEEEAESGPAVNEEITPPSTTAHPEDEMALSKAPGIAMLAGGGVFLLSAVITGSVALSLNSDLKDKCPQNYCFAPQHEDVDRVNSLAAVTDAFIPLSVVLFISGTSVYIASRQTARKYGKKKSASRSDDPMQRLSFTGSGVAWRF